MERSICGLIVFFAVLVASDPSDARSRRGSGMRAQPAIGASHFANPQPPSGTQRPTDNDTLRWNTPNANGNFSGPNAGGSSGS